MYSDEFRSVSYNNIIQYTYHAIVIILNLKVGISNYIALLEFIPNILTKTLGLLWQFEHRLYIPPDYGLRQTLMYRRGKCEGWLMREWRYKNSIEYV